MEESSSTANIQLNRSLIVGGGVLVALGGLLGFAGMALLSSALISATRQWVDHLDEPPSEMAKRRWAQTKHAATVGAAAWRDGPEQLAAAGEEAPRSAQFGPGMAICAGRTVAGFAGPSPRAGRHSPRRLLRGGRVMRRRPLLLGLLALLSSTLVAGAAMPAGAGGSKPPTVPASIAAPAGQKVVLDVTGKGVQIYDCKPSATDPP